MAVSSVWSSSSNTCKFEVQLVWTIYIQLRWYLGWETACNLLWGSCINIYICIQYIYIHMYIYIYIYIYMYTYLFALMQTPHQRHASDMVVNINIDGGVAIVFPSIMHYRWCEGFFSVSIHIHIRWDHGYAKHPLCYVTSCWCLCCCKCRYYCCCSKLCDLMFPISTCEKTIPTYPVLQSPSSNSSA